MENNTQKQLLKEYEQKRFKAQEDLEKRKSRLYDSNPKLKEIEEKLNELGISTAKLILQKNDKTYIDSLKKQVEELKLEKNRILAELQLSKDFLLPHYECNICKDSGFIQNNNTSTMCSCLKQKLFDIEYNKSNISKLNTENFSTFDLNLYSDEIEKEKYHSNISPRENIKIIKNIVDTFIKNFDNPDEKNLLFLGNTGLGKTFLSNCIANELLKNGKTVLYQTAPIMLENIIDARFGKTDNNICENVYSVDLLIIDDLGTESINNIKHTELFNIINTRLLNSNRTTKTIISTNLSAKDLLSLYDERIVSRFEGHYNICRFFGDDIRRNRPLK